MDDLDKLKLDLEISRATVRKLMKEKQVLQDEIKVLNREIRIAKKG